MVIIVGLHACMHWLVLYGICESDTVDHLATDPQENKIYLRSIIKQFYEKKNCRNFYVDNRQWLYLSILVAELVPLRNIVD